MSWKGSMVSNRPCILPGLSVLCTSVFRFCLKNTAEKTSKQAADRFVQVFARMLLIGVCALTAFVSSAARASPLHSTRPFCTSESAPHHRKGIYLKAARYENIYHDDENKKNIYASAIEIRSS